MRQYKYQKSIISLLSCIVISIATLAQHDTAYVRPLAKKNYAQLYTGLFSRQLNFISRNKNVSPQMKQVTLASNAAAFVGTNVKYKKLSLYFETTIPNTQLVSKGNTKVKAYSFFVNQFSSKWGVTGFFNFNKGLLTATSMQMPYADRVDMRMLTVGAHIYKIFNSKKFSYLAANSQGLLQLKKQGSFILLTTALFRKIYSTQSIIPDSVSKYHFTGSEAASKNINLYSLQFRPGYIYNFTFKKGKYFIAPAFYLGLGADIHSFKELDKTHKGPNLNWGNRMKIVAGINAKKYYATIEFISDTNTSLLYQSKIYNNYREGSINVAYRF
jgi:Domain of unknown function (DUF4421)